MFLDAFHTIQPEHKPDLQWSESTASGICQCCAQSKNELIMNKSLNIFVEAKKKMLKSREDELIELKSLTATNEIIHDRESSVSISNHTKYFLPNCVSIFHSTQIITSLILYLKSLITVWGKKSWMSIYPVVWHLALVVMFQVQWVYIKGIYNVRTILKPENIYSHKNISSCNKKYKWT